MFSWKVLKELRNICFLHFHINWLHLLKKSCVMISVFFSGAMLWWPFKFWTFVHGWFFQSISALAALNIRTVGVEFERETTVTLFPGFKSVQIKCKKKRNIEANSTVHWSQSSIFSGFTHMYTTLIHGYMKVRYNILINTVRILIKDTPDF